MATKKRKTWVDVLVWLNDPKNAKNVGALTTICDFLGLPTNTKPAPMVTVIKGYVEDKTKVPDATAPTMPEIEQIISASAPAPAKKAAPKKAAPAPEPEKAPEPRAPATPPPSGEPEEEVKIEEDEEWKPLNTPGRPKLRARGTTSVEATVNPVNRATLYIWHRQGPGELDLVPRYQTDKPALIDNMVGPGTWYYAVQTWNEIGILSDVGEQAGVVVREPQMLPQITPPTAPAGSTIPPSPRPPSAIQLRSAEGGTPQQEVPAFLRRPRLIPAEPAQPTPELLPPPDPIRIRMEGKAVKLGPWNPVEGARSYTLQRKKRGEDSYTFVGGREVYTPEYVDDRVEDGTDYWYQVASRDAAGNMGPFSPSVHIETPPRLLHEEVRLPVAEEKGFLGKLWDMGNFTKKKGGQ